MAAVQLSAIRLDALDPIAAAAFWAKTLGWRAEPRAGGAVAVVPPDPTGYPIVVTPAATPKRGQNRIHLDLTAGSVEAKDEIVARALRLGATRADIGQSPDETHTVLADPEGNELCVIPPTNFLAGTGDVGAVNCDGTQALGYFWSRVLGWPLVWDQDEETAIQAPHGGSKITWSGPPLMPRLGRDRWRLELTALIPLADAVDELRAEGASQAAPGETPAGDPPAERLMLDPDGNEFHVVAGAG